MDLFGRKMAREGVTTVGTIERVVVTEMTTGDDMAAMQGYAATVVYLWCRFTDQQGVVRTEEIHKQFLPENIPPPGAEIQVRYMPDDPTKFETSATSWSTPAGPRGWSAGIFDVEDLGGHHAKSLFAKRSLDRQRELFRTGQRAQAEVVNVTCLDPKATNAGLRHLKRSAHEYSLALRAAGREIETRTFVPARCVPQPGDLIQIAVSADGSDVALDTDERYDGPPAQALVFTTPPELAAQRPQDPSLSDQVAGQQAKLAAWQERTEAGMARMAAYRAGETPAPSSADVSAEGAAQPGAASAPAQDEALIAQLTEWAGTMKQARPKMGKRYEKMVHATLDGQLAAGLIDNATYERLLQEALSD